MIATHGRSFYILDDISLLRQLNGPVQTTRLFAPQPAVRSLDRGATIDYFLPPRRDTVKIDILDASGKAWCVLSSVPTEEEKKLEAKPAGRKATTMKGWPRRRAPARAQSRRQSLLLGSPLSRRDHIRRPDFLGREHRIRARWPFPASIRFVSRPSGVTRNATAASRARSARDQHHSGRSRRAVQAGQRRPRQNQ